MLAMNRQVVVTGLGAVTPLGNTVESFWEGLIAGRSGIDTVTRFDPSPLTTRIAGEVKGFRVEDYMEAKEARRTDLFVQYAIAAAHQAIADAGFAHGVPNPDRAGVLIGTGIGGITTFETQHRAMMEKGPTRISPFFIPMMIANMGSGQISIRWNLRGPNHCTVSACASGAHAIGDAMNAIRHDKADLMVCGGAEATLTELCFAGFCSMKAMSTRNDAPQRASRPFDAERDGFVMGEGAGVVVLEEEEHARKRGARIYARMIGYGSTADAHHITAPAPDGEGAARAMTAALEDADLAKEAVGYINAHGTSTPLNDKTETAAVKTVFGEHARSLSLGSTKSMTGHLLGAAGGIEFVATALALARGILPPTINYEHPDPECDLDCVPNEAREATVQAALSNSLGFGGHNVTLAVSRFD
jgi:3-oxoacyl-[acyl-carrier-protein] synthase II